MVIIDSNAQQYKYANIVNFVLVLFRNEFLHQLISKLTEPSQDENKEWNCKNMRIVSNNANIVNLLSL